MFLRILIFKPRFYNLSYMRVFDSLLSFPKDEKTHTHELSLNSFTANSLTTRRDYVYDLLYEKPKGWIKSVSEVIPQLKGLDSSDFRHLCGTVAESGERTLVKTLLKEFGHCIDAGTFHFMFLIAGKLSHKEVYQLLESTSDIELAIKLAAIKRDRDSEKSVYNQLKLDTAVDKKALEDLGASETIIRKSALDAGIQASTQNFSGVTYPKAVHELLNKSLEEQRQSLGRIIAGLQSDTRISSTEKQTLIEHYKHMIEKESTRQRQRIIHDANLGIELLNQEEVIDTTKQAKRSNSVTKIGRDVCSELLESHFLSFSAQSLGSQTHIDTFIEKLLDAWSSDQKKFSREDLCKLIAQEHPQGKTLTNAILYQWKNHPDKGKPNSESIDIICKAFRLEFHHELMLWKIARGRNLDHKVQSLLVQASQARSSQKRRHIRGSLSRALHESSGIPHVRLQELLKIQQLIVWKKGAKIENPQKAQLFAAFTNSPLLAQNQEQRVIRVEQNRHISLFLGDRPQSVWDAKRISESAKNPPGKFLALLTGREGLVPISSHGFARMMGVSRSAVHHMRDSVSSRGGKIDERQARKIAAFVQGLPESADRLLSHQEQVERELIVDGLTGCKSPVGLFQAYLNRQLTPLGEVLKQTRQRRGEDQLIGTSAFELGKETIGLERASALADYLGFTGTFYRQTRNLFIRAAQGHDIDVTPEDVLHNIMQGKCSRIDGLRQLLEINLLTQPILSSEIRIPVSTIRTWFTSVRGGVIVGHGNRSKLCSILGLAHYQSEFHQIYGKANFTSTLKPAVRDAQKHFTQHSIL